MIQFNLLPDVKVKYINARRQKRMVIFVAMMVSLGSTAVLLLAAMYIYVVQAAQITSLNDKIKKPLPRSPQKKTKLTI
jgi:hypothetical protein